MKIENIITEMIDKDKSINYEVEFICNCKIISNNKVIKKFKMPLHQFTILKNIFKDRVKRID